MSFRREFTIDKSPDEIRNYSIEMTPKDPTLPALVISSASVLAQLDLDETDATSDVIVALSTSFLDDVVTFRVKSGVAGLTYRIAVSATLSDGEVWTVHGTLRVADP